MSTLERRSALAGVVAIALWIVGLVVQHALTHKIPKNPTDAQLLAWVRGDANTIILGCWLFMLGCVAFIWFLAVLRSRLAGVEGGTGTLATATFASGVVGAAFGILSAAGDMAIGIDKNDVSAATAGAFHHSSDMFFVGVEMAAIVMFASFAILGLRSRFVPKWWAIVCAVVAVVLVIGPIGWVAVIFGIPVWTLVTSVMLMRAPAEGAKSRSSEPALASA